MLPIREDKSKIMTIRILAIALLTTALCACTFKSDFTKPNLSPAQLDRDHQQCEDAVSATLIAYYPETIYLGQIPEDLKIDTNWPVHVSLMILANIGAMFGRDERVTECLLQKGYHLKE